MTHERFHYRDISELEARAQELGISLPLENDISPLLSPIEIAGRRLDNRVAVQPMEGTDGTAEGAPGELTCRRYERFAAGGAGLIWFEAVATAPEVRASAHQLMLTEENADEFRRLTDFIRETGLRRNGYAPMVIMQATNSGRYSKPHGYPEPLIAYNNPVLEDKPIETERILSDDSLARYSDLYAPMARLCRKAGFDGMDVKCCHRYLASELLSAYTRPGRYGGSYENRTRFIKDCYRAAASEAGGGFFLTSRMNVHDGFEYPWGFGAGEDVSEGVRLVSELKTEFDIPLINITIGNPYKNPHVNRPYDMGNYIPDEHPLEGVARMMRCVSAVQKGNPSLPVIGSAFTYARQFSPQLASGMISGGMCAMAGFGRMAFAYPDFVRDLKENGALDPKKVCLTCGKCAVLLRNGTPAGCVVRDGEVYKL